MKVVNIKPITVPNIGTGVRLVVGVEPYKLLNNKITCNFKVLDERDKVVLKGGGIEIPLDVYDAWGFDDLIIVEYVAQTQLLDIIDVVELESKPKKDSKSELVKITDNIRKMALKQRELIIAENKIK